MTPCVAHLLPATPSPRVQLHRMAQDRQGIEDVDLTVTFWFAGGVQRRHICNCQVSGVALRRMLDEPHGVLESQQGVIV